MPQSFSLLVTAEVELPQVLVRTDYDRTLCLLAVLDRPSAVPAPGGVQGVADLTFVGDNQAKGVSAVPALTVHADPAWSAAWWSADRAATAAALLALAAPFVGEAEVVAAQVKRWRFATPQAIWPEPCWVAPTTAPVVLAGDAFAGPRVEGAVLSGLAAADAVLGASTCTCRAPSGETTVGRDRTGRPIPVGWARSGKLGAVIEYSDELRDRIAANIAAHHRIEVPLAERRHAAVAIVVVDSDAGRRRRSRTRRSTCPTCPATSVGSTGGCAASPAARRSCCAGERRR